MPLKLSHSALVFHDPTYPAACSHETLTRLLPGDCQLTQSSDLSARLQAGCDLLISFHGPYFPKDAWQAILHFLEAGGNLAIFGGMPFTRPICFDGAIEPEQQAYSDQLLLGAFFPLDLAQQDLCLQVADEAAFLQDCSLPFSSERPGQFWSFYPQLTQAADQPQDTGSAGPFDTLLTPLLFVASASDATQPLATPAALFDQQSGRFHGGRWLLSPWQPASKDSWLELAPVIQQLLLLAAEQPTFIEVRPLLASYQQAEAPVLVISSRARVNVSLQLNIFRNISPDHDILARFELELAGASSLQEVRRYLPAQHVPGLYQVELYYQAAQGVPMRQVTGFWVWDEALVAAVREKRLTAGRDYFYQNGQLFPLFGTTYMDSRVQRKFLTQPNPARWDTDFAAMRRAGTNVIRTGIWTAWRYFMPDAGSMNEIALRALDAFVMTACKHNMQVIFTFFAFFPPLFEGQNPWLDPRSIEGQRDFVTLFAQRYSSVALVSWDLINEPSFGDPARIFSTRPVPHYDRFELTAFRNWLTARYTLSELRLRWRLTSTELASWEQLTLPQEHDYQTDIRVHTQHNMLKVMDYTFFSQEMFKAWATTMYATIREAGSQGLVGVGQDEAGARISPQFYAPAVDYTTTHPWWNNDDLFCDMLLDKTMHVPHLIQETGVMFVRDVDMRPWRTEQMSAHLLERKLFMGLAVRSAGLIQWLWHINAYMKNENENSIGLIRPDGSAKPELSVMREFGRLMQILQDQVIEPAMLTDTWVVVPYSQWFLRPSLAVEPVRRAIRLLGYDFGIVPQLVAEQQLADLIETSSQPRAIILPAVQTFQPAAWQALRVFVQRGATLLVSGVTTRDPHYLLVHSGLIAEAQEAMQSSPVSRYEDLEGIPGSGLQYTFGSDKIGSVRKAHNDLKTFHEGAGKIVWSGLPLEQSDTSLAIRQVYQHVFGYQASLRVDQESPLLCIKRLLRDATLYLVISESARYQHVALDGQREIKVQPNRAGAVILYNDGYVATFGGVEL